MLQHQNFMTMPGYAFVIPQMANERNLYSPEMALTQGTLFPELDKPLYVYGMEGK